MGLYHKIFSVNFSYQECILTCIGWTLPQNLFVDFQLSRIFMNMLWWEFTTKSFRQFAAIKNTYGYPLVGFLPKIFSVIFSYQEYSLTCIGGTWTRNLFGDLQLSRILIVRHWWDLNLKSFHRFSAIKNTYEHALMGLYHKIFWAFCSDQEYLWISIGGIFTQSLFGDFQLSRILIDMHWWELNTKSFRRFAAIKNTYCNALVGP